MKIFARARSQPSVPRQSIRPEKASTPVGTVDEIAPNERIDFSKALFVHLPSNDSSLSSVEELLGDDPPAPYRATERQHSMLFLPKYLTLFLDLPSAAGAPNAFGLLRRCIL